MSTGIVLAIVIVALVALGGVGLITSLRRGDARRGAGALSRETRKRDRSGVEAPASGKAYEIEATRPSTDLLPAAPMAMAPYVPIDPDVLGVTRRQFFNRTAITLMSVSLAGFGASLLAFLYPKQGGGFGAKINLGNIDTLKQNIRASGNFFYVPEGRAWLTEYPKESLPNAKRTYDSRILPGLEAGVVALYQKCPHLGCRVPNCSSSQWFECPCHGSQYNRVGEKKGGPAPRGMDRFTMEVSANTLTINTGKVVLGPPIGTNTTGQEAEGPHCVSGEAKH